MFDKHFFAGSKFLKFITFKYEHKIQIIRYNYIAGTYCNCNIKTKWKCIIFSFLNEYFYKQYKVRGREMGTFLYLFSVIIDFTMHNM